jgi:hypothetical protein
MEIISVRETKLLTFLCKFPYRRCTSEIAAISRQRFAGYLFTHFGKEEDQPKAINRQPMQRLTSSAWLPSPHEKDRSHH